MIYVDHAATTRLSDRAFEAMLPWLKEEYGNPSQPYSFSRKPRKAIAEARESIAACIGAQPEEISSRPAARKAITGPSRAPLCLSAEKVLFSFQPSNTMRFYGRAKP